MRARAAAGFSLVELAASLAIGAVILSALGGIATQTTRAREQMGASVELQQQAQFALERIVRAARSPAVLFVPRRENAGTAFSESVRNVLAMSLDPSFDRDANGFADADNDRDGRVDEDFGDDSTNDGRSGITGIDDDGDGSIDEGDSRDDDESGSQGEDRRDGVDNDGDGLVDEDFKRDMNEDGKPGLSNVDDDGDSSVDEGAKESDDEEGVSDEDWLDTVVFRLNGTILLERLPDLNAASGSAFTERPIADGVTVFRVEYVAPVATGRPALLDITLTLVGANGATATLNTRVRAQPGI